MVTSGTMPAGTAIGGALGDDSVWRGYMQAIGPHEEPA